VVAGGIVLSVVWSRALPAEPSSVRVHRDSLGHHHAKRQAARAYKKVARQRQDAARK